MRTVDRRCIYLSRLEVKEILIKHLCAANPGYEPAFQDQLGDTVDLGDLPPEIEVQLTPVPAPTPETTLSVTIDGRVGTVALV